MKRYCYGFIVIIALCAAINGCKKSEPQEAPAKAEQAAPQQMAAEQKPAESAAPVPVSPEANVPAPAPAIDPNAVAVTVDGVAITEGEIEEKMAPRLKAMSGQVPAQYMEKMKQDLRNRALQSMIIEQVLSGKVKEKGITVDENDVNAEIAKQIKEQGLNEDDFKKVLGMYGLSFEQYTKQVRQGLAFKKLLESEFGEKANVTDEEAKKYYDENIDKFKTPEEVRASHILISTRSTDPNADPNKVKAEALKKAEDILAQLKKGADFAELAKKDSADTGSAAQGGDLGWFRRGQMVKPFEEAAFALEPNQISGIVETDFGYHIIKVTGHKDASTESFEEAKPKIVEMLSNQKKGELVQEYIKSAKASAKIVYPPGKEPTPPAAPSPMNKPAEPNTSGEKSEPAKAPAPEGNQPAAK
jgi:peptidyl-prolyl cis-trans isomerase C